jgi:hypothetical protein
MKYLWIVLIMVNFLTIILNKKKNSIILVVCMLKIKNKFNEL